MNARPLPHSPSTATPWWAALVAAAALVHGQQAWAQASGAGTDRPGSTARKAVPAANATPARPEAPARNRKPAAAPVAAAPVLSPADDDQRFAFSLAHMGEHLCEFRRVLRVLPHPGAEGYVDLHFDRQVITARPVLSSTGALRFEDIRGQFLMLQIAFKSMLMDTRNGQRVADECVHDNHHEARRQAESAPPAPGLGISNPATR